MNKKNILLLLFCFCLNPLSGQDYSIDLQPIWKNLEANEASAKQFGGKWILVGSITFKKRSKENVALHSLRLQWNGAHIPSLFGTLYKKVDGKTFLPLEENMICDGTWLPHQQALVLNFNKKISLGLTNTFYVVLTIPEESEALLKDGVFALDERILPEPFTNLLQGQQIAFAYHETSYSHL